MVKRTDFLLAGVLLAEVACVGLAALLAYTRHPSNHWGADIRWAYILGVVGLIYGIFLLAKAERKGSAILAIAASLVFSGVIYSTDKFNVLVQYERWVQRGMPPSPFAAHPR